METDSSVIGGGYQLPFPSPADSDEMPNCDESLTGDLPPEPPVALESDASSPGDLEPAKAETMVKGTKDPKGKAPAKRNYFWCPILDCASGPVQNVCQHLTNLMHRKLPDC